MALRNQPDGESAWYFCDACSIDPLMRIGANLRKPEVAHYMAPFAFQGSPQALFNACLYHREVLDMPPPDDWVPANRRNRPANNDFMMDLENAILRDFTGGYVPKGPRRHEDPQWAALIRRNVDPHHSDVTWAEYVAWVSDGGGDEWFQEESSDEEVKTPTKKPKPDEEEAETPAKKRKSEPAEVAFL